MRSKTGSHIIMAKKKGLKPNIIERPPVIVVMGHIDHGKSTLSDRIIEKTGSIEKRDMKDRLMDTLELEQEKGITIKLQTARMHYKYNGDVAEFKGEDFVLNLIDTPGHVDFSYEVCHCCRYLQLLGSTFKQKGEHMDVS